MKRMAVLMTVVFAFVFATPVFAEGTGSTVKKPATEKKVDEKAEKKTEKKEETKKAVTETKKETKGKKETKKTK